jgi:cytochrome c oxidase cbb3-type subunit 4
MDVNDLRILITALSFGVFAGIVIWAYSGRQRARFDEAANLPFADSELPGEAPVKSRENSVGVRS